MKARLKRARRQRRRAKRRSIAWAGPTAARLPKILSVSYDDVTLFAGRMT